MFNPFITNDVLKLYITNGLVNAVNQSTPRIPDLPGIPTDIGGCNHCPTPGVGNSNVTPLLYYALGEILTKSFNRF
jgi:hypothetical protein